MRRQGAQKEGDNESRLRFLNPVKQMMMIHAPTWSVRQTTGLAAQRRTDRRVQKQLAGQIGRRSLLVAHEMRGSEIALVNGNIGW